jgi:hypothetical protein
LAAVAPPTATDGVAYDIVVDARYDRSENGPDPSCTSHLDWLDERLRTASADVLRAMIKHIEERLIAAEADAFDGADDLLSDENDENADTTTDPSEAVVARSTCSADPDISNPDPSLLAVSCESRARNSRPLR